jgi:hypothetical protein
LRDRDPKRALGVYELGIKGLGETRNSLASRRERAELLATSSYSLRRLHRDSEAGARIAAAMAILKETKDYLAERIVLGTPLYSVVRAQADHEAEVGHSRRALELYDEFLRQVLATDPNPATNLQDAARFTQIYRAMADLNRRLGRIDHASELKHAVWTCGEVGNCRFRTTLLSAARSTRQ